MGKLGTTELYWEDAVVISAYFVIVIIVGIWSSIKSKKDSISGYFLADRNMHWIPIGASLFASNVGSGLFIGLAGSAASSGIGIAGFELNATFVLLLLGWVFVPVYMASGVYTMPEYLKKRFGGERIRIYLAVLALLLYVTTKLSTDIYSGALFINQSLRLDLYGSILVLMSLAAIFAVIGGLTTVIWTDFIQMIIMVFGAFALMVVAFIKVGGYDALIQDYYEKQPEDNYTGYDINNESCSKAPDNYMHLLRSPFDKELPGTGITFGLTVSAVWCWCTDQVIVQRVLSAKNLSHAKGGCILGGYLKQLPLFFLIFPGMAARVLYTNTIACSAPEKCYELCKNRNGCTNIAYPLLVLNLMPAGARGLMLSVMLAALVSSLTSIFNSSSTIFTIDIWTRMRKKASEMELLIVGRLFVLILVAISIAWVPIMEAAQGSQLFHYIQSVTSYLAPPVCAVYVLAISWERINEKGAFWGLMVGLIIGLIRFITEFSYEVPPCAAKLPDPRPDIITKVHYLHFGCILFIIVCAVSITISLLTEPIHQKHLYRLTFKTRYSQELREDLDKKTKDGMENDGFYDVNLDVEDVSKFQKFQQDAINTNHKSRKSSWLKRTLYFICGISEKLRNCDGKQIDLTPEEDVKRATEFLTESPYWKSVCTANAVILIILASFVWGYYA